MRDWLFRREPFKHQLEIFNISRDRIYFSLLMEMGTGKTLITVNNAAWLYAKGEIDALLVVSPNGLTRMWCEQCGEDIPEHISYKAAWYSSQPSKKEEEALCQTLDFDGLKIVAINVEALATVKGVAFVKKFLLSFRSMMVIDESSVIKNPKAIRTKNLLKLSVHAKYRRILTGTPITQGPLDLFTQFGFLDTQILRCQSYFAFRNKYAIMKDMRTAGRTFQVIERYTNLDELQDLIAPHSYRVTKSDCLDLPEKLYSKRYVELSPLQRKLYNQLKKEVLVEFIGKEMSAPLALTKLLRLQQIVGGYFVPDSKINAEMSIKMELFGVADVNEMPNYTTSAPEPIDKINPRVESLIELLEETNGKAIIWSRFRSEISAISERIQKQFGRESVVEYHGGITNDLRSDAIERFQKDSRTRFFIGHVQAGGKGLTLTAANTVVYYSNNFSLEDRLQSEDRCHRIGTVNPVTYIDMIAPNSLDEKVVSTLRDKKNLADLITGDEPIGSWL